MKLRDKTPTRTVGVKHKNDYHDYRNQLSTDFNRRCGYCDDRDVPRTYNFEIDHFVPQTIDSTKVTEYSNLVYACRSCNNAKRNKWPTGDKTKPNDGKEGWIDPCSQAYDEQFERGKDGKIHPKTVLGKWMYENLNLWKKQHEILWEYERLESNIKKLESNINTGSPEEQKDMLIKLYRQYINIIHSFYEV